MSTTPSNAPTTASSGGTQRTGSPSIAQSERGPDDVSSVLSDMDPTAAGDGSVVSVPTQDPSTGAGDESGDSAPSAFTADGPDGSHLDLAVQSIVDKLKRANPNVTPGEVARSWLEGILKDPEGWNSGDRWIECRPLLVRVLDAWSKNTTPIMAVGLGSAGLFACIKPWADANPGAAPAALVMRLILGVYTALGVTLFAWPLRGCEEGCDHLWKQRAREFLEAGITEPDVGDGTGSREGHEE